ncbi:MAG: AI-2E family transporter [Cyclobacteriaceae bacterium]|nr:AI-2E family transporter [Cyclobacteriaceae bacterium]
MRLRFPSSPISSLQILQYIFFTSVILYFGRPLLVPLSFALLISCVLYPICLWLERHKIKRMAAILLSLSLLIVLTCGIVALLIQQIVSFSHEWSGLQDKLLTSYDEIGQWLSSEFNISKEKQTAWVNSIMNQSSGDAMSLIQKTISASAVSAVLLILIPIYAVLILYHRDRWIEVLFRLFPKQGKERIREILHLSIDSYYNFIKGMLLVYLIVGVLNSLGLYILGIPHALLFGLIAALLTFIPYVGILVASLLPISVAWITYNSIWYPLGVIAVFAVVQYLEANLIFPLAVSSRLKINTLVTIVAIITGGILWGVAGMILFIPFIGILKLIADRTPGLKTLAIVLGGSDK